MSLSDFLFDQQAKEESGEVFIKLPEGHILDEVIGNSKLMAKEVLEIPHLGSKHIGIVGPSTEILPEPKLVLESREKHRTPDSFEW